jgi:hypothetical protein
MGKAPSHIKERQPLDLISECSIKMGVGRQKGNNNTKQPKRGAGTFCQHPVLSLP